VRLCRVTNSTSKCSVAYWNTARSTLDSGMQNPRFKNVFIMISYYLTTFPRDIKYNSWEPVNIHEHWNQHPYIQVLFWVHGSTWSYMVLGEALWMRSSIICTGRKKNHEITSISCFGEGFQKFKLTKSERCSSFHSTQRRFSVKLTLFSGFASFYRNCTEGDFICNATSIRGFCVHLPAFPEKLSFPC